MEFTIPLPNQLAPDCLIQQQWLYFSQRFHTHLQLYPPEHKSDDPTEETPMLFFAASHKVNVIWESLKTIDLNKPVTSVKHLLCLVENLCLPYLLVLFERFRFFHLEEEISQGLKSESELLKKQVELCEFGEMKDSILFSALNKATFGLPTLYNDKEKERVNLSLVDVKPPPIYGTSERILSGAFDSSNAENKTKEKTSKPQEMPFGLHYLQPSKQASPKPKKIEIKSKKTKKGTTKIKTKKGSTVSKKKKLKVKVKQTFDCVICERVLSSRKCLHRHIVSKHSECKAFMCRDCDEKFSSAMDYLEHTEVHRKNKRRAGVSYFKPKVRKAVTQKLPCSLCNRSYSYANELRRHMAQTHFNEIGFMCWNCDEQLPDLISYKKHVEKHIVRGRFTCDLCHRANHSITRLFGHIKNHLNPRLKCERCGIVFAKPEYLAKHQKKHIDEPVYNCVTCGKNFATNNRLNDHILTHTKVKRFTCELCGKNFAQKSNFEYHKRWHNGEKPYACRICDKRYRSAGDVDRHMNKHLDLRPHVCELCGKGFRFKSSLSEHIKSHSSVRSYHCKVCLKTFIYRSGLRNHIRENRCPGAGGQVIVKKPRGVPNVEKETYSKQQLGFVSPPPSSSGNVFPWNPAGRDLQDAVDRSKPLWMHDAVNIHPY